MSNRLAFQTQLASIMEVLANAAVAEICKLVDDDYAVVNLQMSQCQRENKALKRKLHLLELKMARGYAERRLRESALNNGRPKVHLAERLRGSSSSSTDGGVFERQIDMGLWSGRVAVEDATSEPSTIQDKSPDVELVEPKPLPVKEEMEGEIPLGGEMEEGVSLIGEDGMVECGRRGVRRSSLQHQDAHSISCQTQMSPLLPQPQAQPHKARHPSGSSNRGVEAATVQGEDDPDVVVVKVEEAEPETQMGLSIQEGVVESSTDDYKTLLPFDETVQNPTQLHSSFQESGQGFSEVSYGASSSLWTNGGDRFGHDSCLPGPSSHCAPLSFLPGPLIRPNSGGSDLGLAVEKGGGFHPAASVPFDQPRVINLLDESCPSQGQRQTVQLSGQGPKQLPGQSSSQVYTKQKVPRKRVAICKFCGKGFCSQANLESHLRTHTGERPYVCNLCGKKFSQLWNMKIHRNIHTGERPYQCCFCPERFNDPSNLKKHQKRHRPQT